jgi:pimeloyl-ACP methyl ester carboxylesterase
MCAAGRGGTALSGILRPPGRTVHAENNKNHDPGCKLFDVPDLIRAGVALAYEEAGHGEPALVLVHGVACNRGFWEPQVDRFRGEHRVVAVDLRGHGDSDAPVQPYTIPGFADDLAWMCEQLELARPVVVGHSLGGLVALELAAARPELVGAAVMIDSVLLPGPGRPEFVRRLVDDLRRPDGERVLRDYFATFFGPHADPAGCTWILDEAARTPLSVSSSIWEEWVNGWDDAAALARCRVPLAYLDAGTPNADLQRAVELCPSMVLGRTVDTGHFSQLESPEQVNAMLARLLATGF